MVLHFEALYDRPQENERNFIITAQDFEEICEPILADSRSLDSLAARKVEGN